MDAAPALDGEALVAARIRAGLSQNELARAMGLSSGQRMSRWERGDARPRNPQMLHALAAALGVAPRELLVPMDVPDLRWLRFVAGLSVEELAQAAHVSVSTLSAYFGALNDIKSSLEGCWAKDLVRLHKEAVDELVEAREFLGEETSTAIETARK